MTFRNRLVGGAILLAVIGVAVNCAHARDEVHWRRDKPTRLEPPPGNGWTAGSPSAEVLRHYQSIYIGVENQYVDNDLQKALELVITGAGVHDLRLRVGEGYYPHDGHMRTSRATDKEREESDDPEQLTLTMTFPIQPEWEWVRIAYVGEKLEGFEVTAASLCSLNTSGRGPAEELYLMGQFSSPGSVQGPMHITDLDLFPINNTVNISVTPWFSGPGGPWAWNFVYGDPDGTPRPQGGVRYSTSGAGLQAGEQFQLTFEMNEPADLEYDLYAFDFDQAEHYRFPLDFSPKVRRWSTVHHHLGAGDIGIELAPEAVGNGWDGPITETRAAGLQTIDADFYQYVQFDDPTAVFVTDGVNTYTPDSVSLINNGTTLRIYFNPGVLPDQTCYTVELAGAIKDLHVDTDCMIRGMTGDVDLNGVVNQADADLIGNMFGMPADESTAFADLNSDGIIDTADLNIALAAFGHVAVCDGCNVDQGWYDGFAGYDAGSEMHGQGGWFAWDMDPTFGAMASNAQEYSDPNSVDIVGDSDLVHEFCGSDSHKWVFSAWCYVPGDFQSGGSGDTAGSYLILLSHYDWADPSNASEWTVQLHADSNTGTFRRDGNSPTSLPLITDAWVEVRVVIDLDADIYRVFYDDAELGLAETWSDGVYGGGASLNIAAADLFANQSTSVFWDDVRLVNSCQADVNDDKVVDIDDLFDVLAHWGEGPGPHDADDDGFVDIDDIFFVLSNWGPCP